eukprot:14102815-Alexandrium_andersonii.AAC.1
MRAASSRPAFATSTIARAGTSARFAGPLGVEPGFVVHDVSVSASSALPGAMFSIAAGSPRGTSPAGIPLVSW